MVGDDRYGSGYKPWHAGELRPRKTRGEVAAFLAERWPTRLAQFLASATGDRGQSQERRHRIPPQDFMAQHSINTQYECENARFGATIKNAKPMKNNVSRSGA